MLGHAEGGNDHDVFGGHDAEVEAPVGVGHQELDPQLAQSPVHMRVVDDLPYQKQPALGELVTRFVGVLNRPVDAVAVAELLGQPDRQLAGARPETALAEAVDQA